jgi:Kef-type K+ transport system membrane component KefB
MPPEAFDTALLVMMVGGVVVAALLVKAAFGRVGLPALVGYLAIGISARFVDDLHSFFPPGLEEVFGLLGKLGVILLLFRVGLESKLHQLLGQLQRATPIWVCNLAVSAAAGVAVAWALGLGWVPALIVGAAMSATSVGAASAVWQDCGAIDTDEGQLFVDVAELDDISGVVILATLLAVLPTLRGDGAGAEGDPVAWRAGSAAGWMVVKVMLFAAGCWVFATFAERRVVSLLRRFEPRYDAILSISAVGIIIAGLAGLLGFSVAIGAFFAGLAFSRSRQTVEGQTPYIALHDLLTPFFFVAIGLHVPLSALGGAGLLAMPLLATAVVGKIAGTSLPGLLLVRPRAAAVLGVSMVPRAEITLIILGRALTLGGVISRELFSAMVLTALATCLLAPPGLRMGIRRWVPASEGRGDQG